MIKDKLENASIYYDLSDYLKKGFLWLESVNLNNLSDGRYEIDGDNVFASIQTYEKKEDAKYESHKKYIDIQYMIDGTERVGVTNLSNCTTCIEYDNERDLEFYDINVEEEFVELSKGYFVVLYPHDAHKPSISLDEKSIVRKVVVKVAL